MEAIALGIAIGAGAMFAIRHGRTGAKKVVGWTARQAGWITERVRSSVNGAKAVVREQYQRGHEQARRERKQHCSDFMVHLVLLLKGFRTVSITGFILQDSRFARFA